MENKKEWIVLFLLMLVAYIFSVTFRFIYIEEVKGVAQFYFHHQLMINNPDGYYYAEGARDILACHRSSYLSPIDAPLSILTAYFAKFFHVSLDTTILYMPGIFASLIVIPLILIGRILKNVWVGFLASLLAGIAWSYYNRTMFGYYDTDMLIVVLPMFAIWAVIESLLKERKIYYFFSGVLEIIMIYWHNGLYNIANGIFIMSFVYILFCKLIKKRNVNEKLLFLFFIIVPLIKMTFLLQLILLIILYVGEKYIKIEKLNFFYLIIIIGILYLGIVGIPWINNVLHNNYFTKVSTNSIGKIKYYDVVNTVREASRIDYNVLVHRISGSWIGFILGAIGLILLIIRYPVMIISLPMIVLGLFALKGGLRFTIFAVPFFALGDAYLFWYFASYVSKLFKDKIAKYSKYVLSFVFMAGVIYPNIIHDKHYIMPTVLDNNEVKVLEKLKHIANEKDYVVTWWDYGYAIRYYAHVRTLIDGGKHSGDVDFPVSYALTRPQIGAYNASILDVYLTEKDYKEHKKYDFVKQVMQMYHLKNPNEIYSFLLKHIHLPEVKREIFYYLPYRMINIFPTIALFSSLNLKNGKVFLHFFYSSRIRVIGNRLVMGRGVNILLNKRMVQIRNKFIPIKNFVVVGYNKNGKLIKRVQKIYPKGLNVIVMRSYGRVLLMDDFFYNSSFIQMFVLGNVNKKLFKPVINNPLIKVYKIVK
jgi:dolichyl-diphosphooligosaccharide--protein glycosyltransferase/undecaprenyl-diphosphooligosaccharide--protein glycosyltransferase